MICSVTDCENDVSEGRLALGYTTCLFHGEQDARKVKHTIVPVSKSNDTVTKDLSQLQSSNKGPHR